MITHSSLRAIVGGIALLLSVFALDYATAQESADDQYRVAAGYYARGQWSEAVQAFDKLITDHPDSERAQTAMFFQGEAYVQQMEYSSAFDTFNKFLESGKSDKYQIRAAFRRAEAAFFAKPSNTAIKWLKKFHDKHPANEHSPFVLAYLGQSYLKNKQYDEAVSTFETCLKKYPNSSLARKNWLGLARACQKANKNDRAVQAFAKLADAESPDADALIGLGHHYFRTGKFALAEKQYEKFVAAHSGHVQSTNMTYWLGRSQMAQSNWSEGAKTLSSIATSQIREPLGSSIFFDAAVCWFKLGEHDHADRLLRQLRDQWPNSQWADDSLSLLVESANRSGNHDRVKSLAKEFRQFYPNNELLPRVLQTLGRSQYETQNFRESKKLFADLLERLKQDKVEKALRKNENAWRYLLAASQIGLKEYEASRKQLEKIKPVQPESTFATTVSLALATANIGAKNYEAAATAYEQYLKIRPAGAYAGQALSDLSIVYGKTRQFDKAMHSFERLEQIEADPEMLKTAALAVADYALEQKKYDLAKRAYQTLVDRTDDPDTQAGGLTGLFWVYHDQNQIGDRDKVLQSLMKSHSKYPDTAKAVLASAKSKIDSITKPSVDDQDTQSTIEQLKWIALHHRKSNMAGIATIELAILLRKSGQNKEAQQLLEQFLADRPTHESVDAARYELGWHYLNQNKRSAAASQFGLIIQQFKQSQYRNDALFRSAKIAFDDGDFVTAEKLANELDLLRPSDKTLADHALQLRGRALLNSKQLTAAQSAFTLLLRRTKSEKTRRSAAHYLADSIAGSWLQKATETAKSHERFITEQRGFNPDARKLIPHVDLRVCQKLAERSQFEVAQKIAEKTQIRFKDFEKQYELDFIIGRSLANSAQFEAARKRYQAVVNSKIGATSETAAKAQWMIGETYFHQELFAEALTAYYKVDSVFSFKQWRAAALLQAGKCQERLENLTQARTLYRQVINLLPKSPYAKQAETRLSQITKQARNKKPNIR